MKTNVKIRTKPDYEIGSGDFVIGGWLSIPGTYLWFGNKAGKCLGVLSGPQLYRLAKAIVRRFEYGKKKK